MALLKAFVCQVVLIGLYKLFLEEVVEAHLVPDELTRNCIVGFVCLVCFGIQLYTDKPDEDYAEADENPKSESRGPTSTKRSEPSEIPATHETVGSNESSRATTNSGIFAQFSPNMSDVNKPNGTGIPDVPASTVKTPYNQEVATNPVLNGFSETNICEESDDDAIEIDQFVTKESDKEKLEQLETVKDAEPIKSEYVTEEAKHLTAEVEVFKPEDATEETKQSTSDEPEVVEPIKGGLTGEPEQLRSIEGEDVKVIKSEDVIEEVNQSRTDVEAIKPQETTEADVESKCLIANVEAEEVKSRAVEPEEPIKGEDVTEPELATVEVVMVIKSEDVIEEVSHSRTNEEAIKPEEVTEVVVESKCLIANGNAEEVGVFNPQGVTEEVKQSTAIEDEIEATQSEEVEAVVESECLLANGDDNLPTQDSDKNTNLKIGESSEGQMANGIAEEHLNNIDSISLNIIEETKSKSLKDESEIGNGQETTLSSQPDEYTNGIKESLPSRQEISNTISISTKVVNDLETDNKNEETTTLVLTAVSSPSEKLTASTTRQKATVAADVCVAPITIDISFIYACH